MDPRIKPENSDLREDLGKLRDPKSVAYHQMFVVDLAKANSTEFDQNGNSLAPIEVEDPDRKLTEINYVVLIVEDRGEFASSHPLEVLNIATDHPSLRNRKNRAVVVQVVDHLLVLVSTNSLAVLRNLFVTNFVVPIEGEGLQGNFASLPLEVRQIAIDPTLKVLTCLAEVVQELDHRDLQVMVVASWNSLNSVGTLSTIPKVP